MKNLMQTVAVAIVFMPVGSRAESSSSLRRFFCGLCLILAGPVRVFATTIDPLTWEELVFGADLVGMVECEVAGGIVAEYRILESWKGPADGTKIRIQVAVNYWEPQFPIALCGQRFLVTAFKSARSRVLSFAAGGPVPLWWRTIPADYGTPLFQGIVALPLEPQERPTPREELDSVRSKTKRLLSLKPDDKELEVLRSLVRREVLKKARGAAVSMKAVLEAVELAKSPQDALKVALAFFATEGDLSLLATILEKCAGPGILKVLEELPEAEQFRKSEVGAGVLEGIRGRLSPKTGKPDARNREPPPSLAPPRPEDLERFRKILEEGKAGEALEEALGILLEHDPQPAAKFVVGWQNNESEQQDSNRGYSLGSYAAKRCGKDRKVFLRTLLDAKDPFIRVAGAVYLCFEDKEEGMKALQPFLKLPSDPGGWAALALASRDDRGAVPRALELLREPCEGGMRGVPHGNLQKRLMVLLSNAARQSEVPQPPWFDSEGRVLGRLENAASSKKLYEDCRTWWETHRDKVILKDPWLPLLEVQKVD